MSTGRNRSEGWTYAKRSGHQNEDNVEQLFEDELFCRRFEQRLNLSSKIASARVGGIKETSVDGIFGRKTKKKADLTLILMNGETINISIKKSKSGQVFLVTVKGFIAGFEKIFSKEIPSDVKDALFLYFSGNGEADKYLSMPEILAGQNADNINYQKSRHRLNGESLKKVSAEKYKALLQWFSDNIGEITEFAFVRGFVKNPSYYPEYVWYIDKVDRSRMDIIFKMEDIIKFVPSFKKLTYYGKKTGESTIELPFGFIEYHLKSMQFHHKLETLNLLGIPKY